MAKKDKDKAKDAPPTPTGNKSATSSNLTQAGKNSAVMKKFGGFGKDKK